MRKFFFLFYILLLTISPALAQEDQTEEINEDQKIEESSNAYFDLELQRGTQNPLNKKIPFTLYITPKIDSPKTQILWDIPLVFEIDEKHNEFVALEKGQTYSFEISLKPEREGSFNIAANVISWQYDTNKSNTVEQILQLNSGLVVQPTDPQYLITLLIIIVAVIIISGLMVFLVVKSVKKGIVKLRKWLTPPF